jgi:hypothetical protein
MLFRSYVEYMALLVGWRKACRYRDAEPGSFAHIRVTELSPWKTSSLGLLETKIDALEQESSQILSLGVAAVVVIANPCLAAAVACALQL